MSEFKVNEYITLKLEGTRTVIYVKGERFRHCKYLLLNIPIDEIDKYDEIRSIDEAEKYLDGSLEGKRVVDPRIDPDVEFWGHCSNFQAWYENGYDTTLMHRNLAFLLLKRLVDAGDRLAKNAFKDEIAMRFMSGENNVIQYLMKQKYLDYLERDELHTLSLDLKDALKESPYKKSSKDSASIWYRIGEILYMLGDFERSLEAFSSAFKLDPHNLKCLVRMSRIYRIFDDLDNSIKCLQKILDKRPEEARGWLNLGILYHLNHDGENAINCMKKYLELKPKDAALWMWLGKTLNIHGRYKESIEAYENIKTYLDNPRTRFGLEAIKYYAQSLRHEQRLQEASYYEEKLRILNNKQKKSTPSDIGYKLAKILKEKRQKSLEQQEYETNHIKKKKEKG